MAITPLALNTSTKLYVSAQTPQIYRLTGLNVNQANTDLGSFTGLPALYVVRRLTFNNASATPTLSTVDLRTAAAGAGTAIVSAQALASLTAAATLVDATLAVTTSTQTASSLVVRGVAAAGGAATVDATLVIDVLTP